MLNIDTRLLELVRDADQMFLLMHICKRVNASTGQCFPSNATLQKDTGWGKTKVYEVRQELIDLGIIKITERRLQNNNSLSTIITLNTELISFFVNAKSYTKNMVAEDIPPSAHADTPLRSSEPPPSAHANTELINQYNKLTIEHTPISPKGDLGDSLYIEEKAPIKELAQTFAETYQRVYHHMTRREIPITAINLPLIERKIRKLGATYDHDLIFGAMIESMKDSWEQRNNYPSSTINKLFDASNILRWTAKKQQISNTY